MSKVIKGLDARYTVNKEFCGYTTQMYVARFCGEWIGAYTTLKEAEAACVAHNIKRF